MTEYKSQVDEQTLDELIKKSQTAELDSFTSTDVANLAQSFTFLSPSIIRSKAYVLLSAMCQKVRGTKDTLADEQGTQKLSKFFGPHINHFLSQTNDDSLRVGICTLHALFQVDWPSAVAILSEEGAVENIMDGLDMSRSVHLDEDVAHLLGQASGHKRCRELIPTQAVRWLEAKSKQSSNSSLRAAAAVALVKYSRGINADASEDSAEEKPNNSDQEIVLADMMKGLVVSGQKRDTLSDAVEALAYLSTRSDIKETLSSDPTFLRQLFALIPRKKVATSSSDGIVNSTLIYGVLVIISNICAYRAQLSEEQAQLEKLKNMAQSAKKNLGTAEASVLESDVNVRVRVRRLVDAGALDVLPSMLASDSLAVRLQLGKTLLNVVEDKENRGKVLQTGGAKLLSSLIKHALETLTSKERTLDSVYLDSIQALAKLAITSSPVQVFGPDIGAVFNAIRPFSILLQHPTSSLLQKFEANMALTNLSSYQPEVAEHIAQADALLSRVELLMLDDHVLVRRSAVELICNLIAGSDKVFELYGGAPDSPNAKSKLQILVALADVDDLSTALAASGALATLTCSPHACKNLALLQQEHRRVLSVLTQLIDPSVVVFLNESDQVDDNRTAHENSGLVHRGVVCVRNLLKGVDDGGIRKILLEDSQSVGLVNALVRLVKGEGITKEQMVQLLATETLKYIMESST